MNATNSSVDYTYAVSENVILAPKPNKRATQIFECTVRWSGRGHFHNMPSVVARQNIMQGAQ